MGQVLHGSATTTEAVRRAIQHSQASLRALAKRYEINQKTVAKWKGRTSVADAPAGPKEPRSTVLSAEEEAVVVAFRRHTLLPGLGSIETVELLQMGDEIAAAFGRAGIDDELAREVIERPQHRDFVGLPGRRDTQVRPRLRPGAGEIGMGQRLALVTVEKNDVARLGLLFAQLQAQAHAVHLALRLTPFQSVPRPPPAELFFAGPWTVASG